MSGETVAQCAMVMASEPDDVTGKEGVGVQLRAGAAYAVARALERKGWGHVQGPGGDLPGMYWNNWAGLALRRVLRDGA
jgi:hypothetical protein